MSQYIRMPTSQIDDIWYTWCMALIQKHTGWYSLDEAKTLTDQYLDGDGSAYLRTRRPLNSISSLLVNGTSLSDAHYLARWDGVYLRTFYQSESFIYSDYRYTGFFPEGIGNIKITYNAGGTDNLPEEYLGALQASLVLIVKEFSTLPRQEGSDQIMKRYNPNRTAEPEEALRTFGIHGKIQGILNSTLPKRILMR